MNGGLGKRCICIFRIIQCHAILVLSHFCTLQYYIRTCCHSANIPMLGQSTSGSSQPKEEPPSSKQASFVPSVPTLPSPLTVIIT